MFSFSFIKPFGENIIVLLILSNPLSSCSYLSSFLLFFHHIPFPNPISLHLGPSGFSVVAVLIVVVFFISVFCFFFPFFCLCLLCCFDIMTTNIIFPAILVFERGVLICEHKNAAIREMFCSFFSPKCPFSKTLSVCHVLVIYFCSVFPFNISCFLFCFINPF